MRRRHLLKSTHLHIRLRARVRCIVEIWKHDNSYCAFFCKRLYHKETRGCLDIQPSNILLDAYCVVKVNSAVQHRSRVKGRRQYSSRPHGDTEQHRAPMSGPEVCDFGMSRVLPDASSAMILTEYVMHRWSALLFGHGHHRLSST